MRVFTLSAYTLAVLSAFELSNQAQAVPAVQMPDPESGTKPQITPTHDETEELHTSVSHPEGITAPVFSHDQSEFALDVNTPELDPKETDASGTNASRATTGSLAQVTPVHELADVHPDDWAAQALQSLRERYGCISGYPDATYRGDRPITRYEFAAGLNACLNEINQFVATAVGELAASDRTFQRLLDEFKNELTELSQQVDAQEEAVDLLTQNQFSTTTKLSGRAIFTVLDAFGDDIDVNTTFSQRATINFDTSFLGRDRLRTRLRAGNGTRLDDATGFNEPRLGFDTDTDNAVTASSLQYSMALGDNVELSLGANGTGVDDFTDVINPFFRGSGDAISRFARRNTIYRVSDGNTGVGASIRLNDTVSVDVGYSSGEANDPEEGSGFFNGNYGALGQLTLTPGDRFAVGLTYIHAYAGEGDGISTGTGSQAASLEELGPDELERPVVSNSYGIQASYDVSDRFAIGGWYGYTSARVIGLGDADVSNWAVTLAFPDLGKEGNVGGIIVGMQPRLTGVSQGLRSVGQEADSDVGLHIEGFYRHELTDNIEITPGFIWITAPGHNSENVDIVVAAIRTLFKF